MNFLNALGIRGAIKLGLLALIYSGGVLVALLHAEDTPNSGNPALSEAESPVQQASPAPPAPDVRTIPWETIHTHLHSLEIARITLSPQGDPPIWALAEIGPHILFASRLGQFGYLDAKNQLTPLDLQTPMGLDALSQSALINDPVFDIGEVRTLDLLSVQTGADTYDLYASYHRYTGECFQMVVSRRRLALGADGITVASPDWEEIYVVRPCIEIKDISYRFAGHEAGGRLVLLNETTLLLSVGAYQLNGVYGPGLVGMDPETDLSKIIEISIPQRRGRIYAMGVRNPQGLLVARDGRIWETEHGPAGGDEVNLIRRGSNYGWPLVTYGLQYGSPPPPWPHNPRQGQHLGYEPPRFAFVPAIGISNIIQPDPEEFPLWSEHLLAASLRAESLFALKTEGDSIVYAEAIKLDERLRDIISLHDGRIAILTDSGELILIRNPERHIQAAKSITVSGQTAPVPPHPLETSPLAAEGYGARVFHYYCRSCHTVTGETLAGPPLNGLMERGIAAFAGFPYSKALATAGGEWTDARLRAYLKRTDPGFAETTMPTVPLEEDQFEALVAYLRTTRERSDPLTR